MTTCDQCGCRAALHDEDGCHGRQHLTPWDTEECACSLTREEVESRA